MVVLGWDCGLRGRECASKDLATPPRWSRYLSSQESTRLSHQFDALPVEVVVVISLVLQVHSVLHANMPPNHPIISFNQTCVFCSFAFLCSRFWHQLLTRQWFPLDLLTYSFMLRFPTGWLESLANWNRLKHRRILIN